MSSIPGCAKESPTAKERKKDVAIRRLSNIAEAAIPKLHVPGRFRDRAHLSKLDWVGKHSKGLLKYCARFVEAYSRQKDLFLKAPLLMSASGLGKTHLLFATAVGVCEAVTAEIRRHKDQLCEEIVQAVENEDWQRYKEIEATEWAPNREIFVTCGSDIAHELRESVHLNNVSKVVAKYRQATTLKKGGVGILFIDDIEVMKMSDWLHEELYRIIDFRYAEGMPTMMATNLSLPELKKQLGDRLIRRIEDMTEPFILS